MTQIQLGYLQAQEQARSNAANEAIRERQNDLTASSIKNDLYKILVDEAIREDQLELNRLLTQAQAAREYSSAERNAVQNYVDRITKIQDGAARAQYHEDYGTAQRIGDISEASKMYASKDRGAIAANSIAHRLFDRLFGGALEQTETTTVSGSLE
jgi:hypothetical protein